MALGRSCFQEHQSELMAASRQYGVPPQYIVALWGMESNFGQLQGREDIISALATLAFEGRRETFFTNELIAALKMIQQGHISAQEMKGSGRARWGRTSLCPALICATARMATATAKSTSGATAATSSPRQRIIWRKRAGALTKAGAGSGAAG